MSCLSWLEDLELRGLKIVIAGPPCSGKTTFAATHRLAGDEILDYDVVHAELTGLPLYVHDELQLSRTIDEFGRRASALRQGWIITSSPTIEIRRAHRAAHHSRAIVLPVPKDECRVRLERTSRPPSAKCRLHAYIGAWWGQYRPDLEAQRATWLGVAHETELLHFELPASAPAISRRAL